MGHRELQSGWKFASVASMQQKQLSDWSKLTRLCGANTLMPLLTLIVTLPNENHSCPRNTPADNVPRKSKSKAADKSVRSTQSVITIEHLVAAERCIL
jgi:hypothetical protein